MTKSQQEKLERKLQQYFRDVHGINLSAVTAFVIIEMVEEHVNPKRS